jgi:hypothetical protein
MPALEADIESEALPRVRAYHNNLERCFVSIKREHPLTHTSNTVIFKMSPLEDESQLGRCCSDDWPGNGIVVLYSIRCCLHYIPGRGSIRLLRATKKRVVRIIVQRVYLALHCWYPNFPYNALLYGRVCS